LHYIVAEISRESLKRSIRDHAIVTEINKGYVIISVTSKMTEMLLKKMEIRKDVEDVINWLYKDNKMLVVLFNKPESSTRYI